MPRVLTGSLVVVTSAVVLVVELVSVRLAAPYVGLTLETYSAAIGAALLGIALGAAFGGRAADRWDPRRFLGPVVIAGGVLVLLVRPLAVSIGPGLQGTGSAGSAVLIAIATVPPVTVLASVPPAVVKLVLGGLDRTGSVVGSISALGTAGALGGTFVTGFIALGTLGTRDILLVAGGITIALGLVTAVVLQGTERVPLLMVLTLLSGGWLVVAEDRCDTETAYFCARLADGPEGTQLVLLDDLIHAAVDEDQPATLQLRYVKRMARAVDSAFPGDDALEVLHVGGGGFTLPRYLAATRPGSVSRVLELDPGVVEFNRERLGLRTGPELSVAVGDARTQIAEEPRDGYDAVVGDAFASRSPPWHLTTVEFVREVRRVLRPDGVYVANLIDGGDLSFVGAEIKTLQAVFANVRLLADAASPPQGTLANFVLVASDAELALTGVPLPASVGDANVLTDDRAPVEQLLSGSALG